MKSVVTVKLTKNEREAVLRGRKGRTITERMVRLLFGPERIRKSKAGGPRTSVVTFRISPHHLQRLDEARGPMSRSEWIWRKLNGER